MSEKTQEMTDLEDRKPDAEASAPDDIKGCVGATGGGDGAASGSAPVSYTHLTLPTILLV